METANKIGLKIGDILRCSWGYDQTNVDYYQVIRTTASTAWIREIQSQNVEGDCWTGKSVPVKDAFKGEILRRKIHTYSDEPIVKIESYSHARLWNGKPQEWTAYA